MHGHGGGGAHSSTALRPLRSLGLPRPPRRRPVLAAAGAARGNWDAAAGTTTQALAEAETSSPGPRRHERAAARRTPGAVARLRRPVMGSCVSRGEDPAARDAARGGSTSARAPGKPRVGVRPSRTSRTPGDAVLHWDRAQEESGQLAEPAEVSVPHAPLGTRQVA